jgi:hypothetical protein
MATKRLKSAYLKACIAHGRYFAERFDPYAFFSQFIATALENFLDRDAASDYFCSCLLAN